ncbi:MAG: hypothetical protein ACRC2T_17525 [Thermoguttaceae bacterium]
MNLQEGENFEKAVSHCFAQAAKFRLERVKYRVFRPNATRRNVVGSYASPVKDGTAGEKVKLVERYFYAE